MQQQILKRQRLKGQPLRGKHVSLAIALCLLACAFNAQAQDASAFDNQEPQVEAVETPTGTSGKLLLTGGVTQVEGSAGGGLTPWAVIGGYGTRDQIGANAYYTRINVSDYNLQSFGALVGIRDRRGI